eukprot:CAMPEP_0114625572 /NCGR_PEP_ID=MMETSP0168-20121206/11338_1 /TAXON_ID=95228 ORGANISM="Vannella sp., Strain DIVA3 517/6/12" /NCGR_SAMPLE_ID=MMETSP0168 /ASSEMBLY_ACC=CAM_ASM_000044 /LENGTH=163 /DNA_ID=CAMNT_0001836855 /DNA_START=122 /DNA_END=613 /DNA_ORIENTATION=+
MNLLQHFLQKMNPQLLQWCRRRVCEKDTLQRMHAAAAPSSSHCGRLVGAFSLPPFASLMSKLGIAGVEFPLLSKAIARLACRSSTFVARRWSTINTEAGSVTSSSAQPPSSPRANSNAASLSTSRPVPATLFPTKNSAHSLDSVRRSSRCVLSMLKLAIFETS